MTTEQQFLGNKTKPTIGRIVHYRLAEHDAQAINIRRDDWHKKNVFEGPFNDGYQAHFGNRVSEGDVFPAMIVRVWGDHDTAAVNLQVFLDGNDTFWATSVTEGTDPRYYSWPARG